MQAGAAAEAPRASLLAPPKDYEGIRLGPYKYIAWPDGEKELYDIKKTPTSSTTSSAIPNYFPIRNFLHRELMNRLEDCVGRGCREEAAETPADPQGTPARRSATRKGTPRKTARTQKATAAEKDTQQPLKQPVG